ncbi:MAG: ATP-binding protein [Treponema sp.]|nr:ATP-binding protein [Treponema sp.]
MNMLDHFEKIISLVKKNGLNDGFFESAQEHLDAAASLFHTNPVQTVLFAILLDNYNKRDYYSAEDISKIIKCGRLQFLKFLDDFDDLRRKRLIRKKGSCENFPRYHIPMDVINAVRKGIEYQDTTYENLSPEEFFDLAQKLIDDADDYEPDTLEDEVNYLLDCNKNICFVQKSKEYDLGEGSVLILLAFCCALLHENKEILEIDELRFKLREIFGHHHVRQILGRFKSGKHKLFEKELIEYDCLDGLADTEHVRLSQKAIDEFLDDVDIKENAKRKGKDYIHVNKIPEKKLFYSNKINERIVELTALLKEENITIIQKRLSENGMRTGFACLFSGPPGTGKTETVYQIARETGRDILLVNIAETKSMWFGESEKRIKAVFDRYRGIVKSGGLAPILLFNEADAILGKRRELAASRSGPGQTENAIQNIILQEMENLNGILIATTNMTVNLDKAFERRFLYKIEFDKPDAESKKMIWQSLLPDLSTEDASRFSVQYDFSGGQIENIARKSTVSSILKGSIPDSSVLETFCKEESLEKTAVKIGFSAD